MITPPVHIFARLRYLGPGIVVTGAVVGSGELILTSSLGATVGFTLLWFLLLACWSKSIVQAELARLCLVTGQTFLQVFNRIPGNLAVGRISSSWVVWFFFLSFVVATFGVGGILGGAVEAVTLFFPGWSYNATAIGLAVLASLIMGSGSYRLLEILLTLMVASFTLITIYCAIALQFSEAALPLSEIIAAQSYYFPVLHMTLIVAVFGYTGVNSIETIFYSYFCVDKGYTEYIGKIDNEKDIQRAKGWLHVMHTDVWITLLLLTVATVPFYFLGAGVLHTMGTIPADGNMLTVISAMYVQTLGFWSRDLFLVGAFLVLYSTVLSTAGGYARYLADFIIQFGFVKNTPAMRSKLVRVCGYAWPFCYLFLLLFFETPFTLILVGAVATALMGPLLIVGILYLEKTVLHDSLKPGAMANFLLYIALALVSFLAVLIFIYF